MPSTKIMEEILKKVIEKSIKNGFNKEYLSNWKKRRDIDVYYSEDGLDFLLIEINDKFFHSSVIFSHEFAKAFWGDSRNVGDICGNEIDNKKNNICCNDYDCKEKFLDGWQYHLQQMVLESDPIKYLEKFIK